jgi:hypothetical protein
MPASACAVTTLAHDMISTALSSKKNALPPVNWRWVEEGDGYVGRLQPPGQPLGVGLPSGLQCLVPYPYLSSNYPSKWLVHRPVLDGWSCPAQCFFILRILQGHTSAAEAASTEGQQQDSAQLSWMHRQEEDAAGIGVLLHGTTRFAFRWQQPSPGCWREQRSAMCATKARCV